MFDNKKAEEEVLKFWERSRIYEKSKKKNSKGKKFYFMDGPPYATGHIHMGTALNKILKDIAMRSRRLQGFDVFDRPGYDTHGVPIEMQVEKEIGSKSKQDIERYGVEKFVGKCRDYATKYISVMNSEFRNLGVWMDWENPYLTLDNNYIESIWSAFKEADKKGLLYLGKYPVHVCPRCETAVAFNEIEYGRQKDTSIFVKFPLKDRKNTSLIIWTTTPWTLPGNTGVMVHPDVIYQEVEIAEGERWIIAKDLVSSLMAKLERGFTVKKEYKGKEMRNLEYENPLAKNLNLKVYNGYKVVLSSRYVTTEEGTGLVHCAPGHGKEDYEVGKEYNLDMPSPVASDGVLTKEAGKYSGKKARVVDYEIIKDLENDGFLVYKLDYEHDYPLCWRDKSPLLMLSQPQWFLKISKIQKKLIEENDKVEWVPSYMKLRMKAWLEGIGDWPVSRQRYWGTPLPIWHDPESGEKIVVGSVDELKKLSGGKVTDLHKPGIDKIEILSKSGRKLKRVPEVLDVWFDSGVSSWAALNYPKEKQSLKRYWPADINIEGKDQFRGWWNSQIILSEITFDKKPFKSILVHGLVLDLGKRKMSKSSGNIISPQDIINKYGRDYLRYYLAKISKGEDFAFDESEFKDIQKIFTILININSFINQLENKKGKVHIEDKWILSRFNSLIEEVASSYNNYLFHEVVYKLERFLVEDLSRTYIQMIRDRSDEVFDLLNHIFSGTIKLLAPICPFITESIWKNQNKNESIHLSEFPKFSRKKIDKKLEEKFALLLSIIEKGLAERDKSKINLRWPLAKASICHKKLDKEIEELLAQQLNVKKIEWKQEHEKEFEVVLDTHITPELESEGFARELARKIQAERKKQGLKKGEQIAIKIYLDAESEKMIESNIIFLKGRTNSRKVEYLSNKDIPDKAVIFDIKDKKFGISFTRKIHD